MAFRFNQNWRLPGPELYNPGTKGNVHDTQAPTVFPVG